MMKKHFWDPSQWNKMCFEYQRIKFQWEKGQKVSHLLMVRAEGADPLPLAPYGQPDRKISVVFLRLPYSRFVFLKMSPGNRTSVSPPSPPSAWGRRCSYLERSSRPSRPPEPSGCLPSSPAPSPPRGSTGTRRSRRSWPGSRRTWLQSGTRCCQEEPVEVFSEI